MAFDPSGKVIASACFDGLCKIYSSNLSAKTEEGSFHDTEEAVGPFKDVDTFGEELISFRCKYWLNSVAWSPSGSSICYASHDGTLNFADVSKVTKKGDVFKYLNKGLPFKTGIYINEDTFIAGGYDRTPFLFSREGGEWKLKKVMDEGYSHFKDFTVEGGEKNSALFF